MKTIPINNGEFTAMVDDKDYERLSQFKWILDNKGYAHARLFMHHMVMGFPGNGMATHHKDENKLNNQSSNLELMSRGTHCHQHNKRAGANKFRGVSMSSPYSTVFKAVIKRRFIGSFSTPEEAARAYDKEATILYGKHAKLNFPDEEQPS